MFSEFNTSFIKNTNCVIISENDEQQLNILKPLIECDEKIKYHIVITNRPHHNFQTDNIYDNLNIIRKINSYALSMRTTPLIAVFDNLLHDTLEDSAISYMYLNGRNYNTTTITTFTNLFSIPMMLYLTTDYLFIFGSIDTEFITNIYNYFVYPITTLEIFTQCMNIFVDINASIVIDRKMKCFYMMRL